MDALLDGEAEAITKKCIELAKAGDGPALRLCLERIVPPRRERTVSFDMPLLEEASDCVTAMASIMRAVSSGDLTPGEADALSRIVEGCAKAIELNDIAERVAKLERQQGTRT